MSMEARSVQVRLKLALERDLNIARFFFFDLIRTCTIPSNKIKI